MSDDTPTQRFDAPLTPTTPSTPAEPEQKKKSGRGLLYALIAIGAAILVLLIIVLIVLFLRPGTPTAADTPTASATPSATPSETPSESATPSSSASASSEPTSPPAPPPATGLAITSFSSPTVVKCGTDPVILDFSWTGSGGVAYFAVGGTSDPKNFGFNTPMPPNGTQADFPDGNQIKYPCDQASAIYTLGMYDSNGHSVVKQLTIKRQ